VLAQIRNPIVPGCLRGPVPTNCLGIPRYWAVVWSALLPGDLAPSTVGQHLRYVDGFYDYAEELLGPGRLDDILASLDVELLSQSLEGYFQFLRNRPNAAPAARWQVVSRFAGDIITRLTRAAPLQSGIVDLRARLSRIEILFSKLTVGSRRMPAPLRSLPADVVDALYELLDPASSSNLFVNMNPAQERVDFGPWDPHEEQKPTYPMVLQGPARLVVAFRAAWWYVIGRPGAYNGNSG
jgi:hypothetical protein